MLTFSNNNYNNNNNNNSNSKIEMMSSNPWYPPPGPSYNFTMDHPPSNSREMRNRAEKMRRDKLNAFIGELATLVPMVARSAKRMDKTSILRLTATHLRIYQTLMNGKGKPQMDMPKQIDQFLLEQLVCEQLGGFLLILTPIGKIVFVSHTVENLLGHLQTDLMGQSIFNIASPDDHERLKTYINIDSNSIDYEWRKYFNIRLKRAGPRTESPIYEPVRVIGVHRHLGDDNTTNNNQNNSLITTTTTTTTTTTGSSRSSNCSNSSSSSSIANSSCSNNNNDILLLFVRVIRPEPLSERLIEASKDEYMTRHLIDGRIINCDQRISLIAGYMTDEVSGISAFKFMHRDDVRWVMIALRQMYDRGESKGSSCYRLLSRNGQFIYLRTLGFLEIDDQGTVESFVCINTLVTEREGRYLISEMKRKFSAMINNSSPNPILPSETDNESTVQSVEDPQKIEAAIIHLITNLPSPGGCSEQSQPEQLQQEQLQPEQLPPQPQQQRSTPSPRVNYENQDCFNNTPATTITTDNNSPNKSSYHMKLKTAPKRPPSTDTIIDNNVNKRQKTQLLQQPQQPQYHHHHHHINQQEMPLYHQGSQIVDSTTTQDEQLYQQQQQHDLQKMLHNNV